MPILDVTSLGLKLPHPSNSPKLIDVARIRESFQLVDDFITADRSAIALRPTVTVVDSKIQAAIAAVVGAAPAELDTIIELVNKFGQSDSAIAAVTAALSGKVSTADFNSNVAAINETLGTQASAISGKLELSGGNMTGPIIFHSSQVIPPLPLPRVARTTNTAIAKADHGKYIDVTSGTFTQTFVAAATLGNGFFCYLRNSGAGDITLDPNASETIDGLTSFIMYPGEARLLQCDGTSLRSIVLAPAVKEFISSANFVTPPGYSMIAVDVVGAGGGGAYGSTSFARGAQGGGGGARDERMLPSPQAGTILAVNIGAGGAGATNGVASQKGGTTNLSDISYAQGGVGGVSQSTSFGAVSVTGPSALTAGTVNSLPRENPSFGAGGGPGGGNGAQAVGSPGNSSLRAGGGGGGGGANDGNNNLNGTGGRGGDSGTFDGALALGGSGGAFVANGIAGTGSTGTAGSNGRVGAGGGGGGYSHSGTGGAGGTGGFPGGGGGGGGNANGTPGNGGAGAAGRVTVRMF